MSWTHFASIFIAASLSSVVSAACDGSSLAGRADVQGHDVDADASPDTPDTPDTTDTTDTPDTTDTTDGDTTAPDVADSEATDVDPDITDADTTDADTADAIDPDLTDPDTADAIDPDTTAPDIGDDTTDPDTTAPDIGDADATDPDIADTDTTDPDSVDPDTSDTTDTTETVIVGPFDDLVGLTGDELRLALRDRIDDQAALGYSPGRAREVMFSIIDAHNGRVECVYTGRTVQAEDPEAPPVGSGSLPTIDTTPGVDCRRPDGSLVPGGCDFNTEHSWPRSLGANNEPAASDLHHLFSTWDMANNRRGNFLFGVTTCIANGCAWHEGASELGTDTAGRTVFEVRPKYRGDIARAQFYFAVRYGLAIPNTTEPTLREWHLEDPVDDIERTRNDRIEIWQGNRNPFVDIPDFVDALFDF